jgi:tetrapyrrole methylase family protein / MazG family protein
MTTSPPRVCVVGLGPGGLGQVTTETLEAISRVTPRFVRTSIHPTAAIVEAATSFDDVYDSAERFEDVYAEIARRITSAAVEHGEVLYAVPGSPLVLERTVRLLRVEPGLEVELVPAVSFLDLAWARLRVDPIEAGVTLVDGHEFVTAAADANGAVLVAHTHANWVLSDIKLSVDDPTGGLDEMPAVILHALGTPDEQIITTTWSEIDRTVEANHLTSLYLPELSARPGAGYVRFHGLTRTLREQCPWDIEQTHRSLVPYLIEESYEVVDAIAALDIDDPATDEALIEELGDLLYQIEFHATIAEQEGRFTIGDVTAGIYDKLVRRHPHVFGAGRPGGGVDAGIDASTVVRNWEAIKRAEKGRTSVFDGVANSLPSLAYANQLQRKAAKVGFDWPDVDGALPKIAEEAAEVVAARATGTHADVDDEVGDLLFAVVNVARHLDVEPEAALRAAANKFRHRFERVEQLATERDLDLASATLDQLDALWDEVKRTIS